MAKFNRDSVNTPINVLSGTTSGNTNLDVYIFVDEFGNVTQIKKESKSRLKYYVDPTSVPETITPSCVIGISGGIDSPDCSEGIGLGVGDNYFALAKYN